MKKEIVIAGVKPVKKSIKYSLPTLRRASKPEIDNKKHGIFDRKVIRTNSSKPVRRNIFIRRHGQIDLTVIITVKNRLNNLKLCLSSINVCDPIPKVILVDFGSTPPINLSYPWLTVLHATTNTGIFHKARAVNIGIKNTNTEFLCITDADQIFEKTFFGIVYYFLELDRDNFVRCKTYDLPERPNFTEFDKEGTRYAQCLNSAIAHNRLHGDGCCHALITSWAKEIHGYNEQFIGHLAEDTDFSMRTMSAGFLNRWITEHTSTVHLPHDKSGTYYKQELKDRNREILATASKLKDPIVNKNITWGAL